jgi:hypothetical protein
MLFRSESERARLSALEERLSAEGVKPADAAQQLLAIEPEHALAVSTMTAVAMESGDRDTAKRLCWQALRLNPLNAVAYMLFTNLYRDDRTAGNLPDYCSIVALWTVAASAEVPSELEQSIGGAAPLDIEVDFGDPETYRGIAREQEEALKANTVSKELWERFEPYWHFKEFLVGALEVFEMEEFQRLSANAAALVPVWRAVLKAWAREYTDPDPAVLQLSIAMLGEYAGPEVLPDLWELSCLQDEGVFNHAHWAIARLAKRFPEEVIASIRALIPGAANNLRCGIAEHLGLMDGVSGVEDTLLSLVRDFPAIAKDDDAPYLLMAVTDALAETGSRSKAKEVFARYERLLSKEGRRWMSETIDSPEGFVPRLVDEQIPEFQIVEICVDRALMDDHDEGSDDEVDDEDDFDEWGEDEDFEGEPETVVPKPGRNEPCWCGSGKKYKKCHLALDEAAERQEGPPEDTDPVRAEAIGGLLSTAERIHKRRDMMEATRQYFGEDVDLDTMEGNADTFFTWYLFRYQSRASGRTAVEEHIQRQGAALEGPVAEMLESWRSSRYGLFEVTGAPVSGELELSDPFEADRVLVNNIEASHPLDVGEYILARLEQMGTDIAFSCDTVPVPRRVVPALKALIEREMKAGGQNAFDYFNANSHRLHRVIKEL